MPTALHPQTLMAFKLSDETLPIRHGYPFKIRIPTKLGFKNPKFVTTIYVTNKQPRGLLDRSRLQLVQRDLSADRANGCAIGVMAKAPQPGLAKTRLCPPLRHAEAAELSAAFLRDITENIALAARSVPIHGCVAYAPAGDEAVVRRTSGRGHRAGAGRRIAADAAGRPGLRPMPAARGTGAVRGGVRRRLPGEFRQPDAADRVPGPRRPARCWSPGERIVLGPADDGGYYLLGMKQPHAHLFADIAWSTGSVAAATRARAAELGLDVVTLPTWYDVDDAATLARLVAGADARLSPRRPPTHGSNAADCADA